MHIICICIVLINSPKAAACASFSRVVFSKKKKVKTRVTAARSSGRVTCMGKSSRTGWHMGCSRAAARHGLQAHSSKKEKGPSHFLKKFAAPGTAFLIFLCRLTAEVMHTDNDPAAVLVSGSVREMQAREGQQCAVPHLHPAFHPGEVDGVKDGLV